MSETEDATNQKLVLCPYCGHAQYGGDRCEVCSGLFEPLSRRATQLAMGPWQIRDKHNPFKPGCCYDLVKKMAQAGKLKPTSVMRGPTTRQFWSVARNVPGVAHLIGYCHACGHHVSPSDAKCGACGAAFTEPRERNKLGLLFKDDAEAKVGQEMLDAEVRGEPVPQREIPGPAKRSMPRPVKADDLLADVLDLSGDLGPAPSPAQKPSAAAAGAATVSAPPTPVALDIASPPQAIGPEKMPASVLDIDPTRELPEGGGISTLGLLMIGANIVALATIIVLFLMLRG